MTKTATFFKMNIQDLYPVIWKELKERRYGGKTMLVMAISIAGFFAFWIFLAWISLVNKSTIFAVFPEATRTLASLFIVFAQLLVMLLVGSAAITHAFYDERVEKTLEPLLCTPLNITVIWLGKVMAVSLVAFLYSIITIIILIILFCLSISLTIPLPAPILLQIFIVSPLLISTMIALTGLSLLITKNISLAEFIGLSPAGCMAIFLLSFPDIMGKLLAAPWKLMGLLLLISLGLTAVIAYCTRFLRREKAVI